MRFKVTVGEVMKKKIVVVNPTDTIKKAADIMKKARIGSVLIVDRKDIRGILTTSDIVYKHVAGGRGKRVKDIMSTKIVSIHPKKTIEDASRLMVKKRIEKLPVIKDEKLMGLITSNDILKIEPALLEVLLERMKLGGKRFSVPQIQYAECEICGNYSDDIEERDGAYVCSKCR